MRCALTAIFLGLSIGSGATWAQTRDSVLISPAAARQLGLERMWFTQLSLGSRSGLAGLHQHVSADPGAHNLSDYV